VIRGGIAAEIAAVFGLGDQQAVELAPAQGLL
jgi:hypothetical protein